MAAAEDRKWSSDYEISAYSVSTESLDLSCIHWGYLNCVLVADPTKKYKDLSWTTYWVDLCGSTLRFYRDLLLTPDAGNNPPPASIIGPTNANEKKEAFLMLKKGALVDICGYEEPAKAAASFPSSKKRPVLVFKSRKKAKRVEHMRSRSNMFKLAVTRSPNSPVYLFQAPSKSSMYRWISKIEEGIDNADKPQSHTTVDNKLKEAKLLAMEQRRYHLAPELKYPDKDDTDSGMEGDVEESFEVPEEPAKPPPHPRLHKLRQELHDRQDLLAMLQGQEAAFLGSSQQRELSKVCEFQATTKADYYLVPGHPSTLVPKATKLNILGQLSNRRWRCYVDLPKTTTQYMSTQSFPSSPTQSVNGFDDKSNRTEGEERPFTGEVCIGDVMHASEAKERVLGSVPTSLLVELGEISAKSSLKTGSSMEMEITPMGTPDVTPNLTPSPSPPLSPYSSHRSKSTSSSEKGEFFEEGTNQQTGSPSNLQHFIPSEDLWDHDAWEQFYVPSPPSSAVTSRSTSPSLSPSESIEALDSTEATTLENHGGSERQQRNNGKTEKRRSGESLDDVPVTYIGGERSGDENELTTIDEDRLQRSGDENQTAKLLPQVVMRLKQDARPTESTSTDKANKNYSFLVTKKLRQRGISLIVGSSSSEEDNDEDGDVFSSRTTTRKLDEKFNRFAGDEEQKVPGVVRPYSAFVPRKRASISFGISSKNSNLRTATTDELLKDYSSPYEKPQISHSNTCVTLRNLGEFSTPENAPPINQRRTLQMTRNDMGGFGFTLQTFGIVQQNGEVEYMTFVLAVEEDGPAYMSGMRPGDVIIAIENQDVEEEDHRTLVALLQRAPSSVRLVVVFVNAIKRMHLNTKIKILKTEIQDREDEFEDLSRKEQELLRGLGGNVGDVEVLVQSRIRQNTYLYTTELTSSFSKDTPNVHDSLIQYRQQANEKPRRSSLPDQSELTKQHLISTTGTQMIKSFASSPEAVFRKSTSHKLQKKVKKARQTSTTFKAYVDIEASDTKSRDVFGRTASVSSGDTATCRMSWPSANSSQHCKAQFEKSHSSNPTKSKKKQEPLKIPEVKVDSQKEDNPAAQFPKSSRTEITKKGSSPKISKARFEVSNESPESTRAECLKSTETPKDSTTRVESSKMTEVPITMVQSPERMVASQELCSSRPAESPKSPSSQGTKFPRQTKENKMDTEAGVPFPHGSDPPTALGVETQFSKRADSLRQLDKRGEVSKAVWPPKNSRDESRKHVVSLATMDTERAKQESPQSRTNGKENVTSSECTTATCSETKERSDSINIAELRKIFEGAESSCDNQPSVRDDDDQFPIFCDVAQKRPEMTRTRLGSRPESFMLAMDSAEASPLIPDKHGNREKKKKKQIVYESSA